MKRLLQRMLDPERVPQPLRHPLPQPAPRGRAVRLAGRRRVATRSRYEPAESRTGLFGGNSNWRGPIWFPLNYLLIEALRQFHRYYGDEFLVEHPTGSGVRPAAGPHRRRSRRSPGRHLPARSDGRRPVFGDNELTADRPALARLSALLRVLPRRYRRRSRRQPPDRLDGAGGATVRVDGRESEVRGNGRACDLLASPARQLVILDRLDRRLTTPDSG